MGSDPEITKILVLDNVKTEDRPGAVGYFVLNFMREVLLHEQSQGNTRSMPQLKLTLGAMKAADVKRENVSVSPLQGNEFAEVYKLVIAVEKNRPDISGGGR